MYDDYEYSINLREKEGVSKKKVEIFIKSVLN